MKATRYNPENGEAVTAETRYNVGGLELCHQKSEWCIIMLGRENPIA